jgi:hypothetical protein
LQSYFSQRYTYTLFVVTNKMSIINSIWAKVSQGIKTLKFNCVTNKDINKQSIQMCDIIHPYWKHAVTSRHRIILLFLWVNKTVFNRFFCATNNELLRILYFTKFTNGELTCVDTPAFHKIKIFNSGLCQEGKKCINTNHLSTSNFFFFYYYHHYQSL